MTSRKLAHAYFLSVAMVLVHALCAYTRILHNPYSHNTGIVRHNVVTMQKCACVNQFALCAHGKWRQASTVYLENGQSSPSPCSLRPLIILISILGKKMAKVWPVNFIYLDQWLFSSSSLISPINIGLHWVFFPGRCKYRLPPYIGTHLIYISVNPFPDGVDISFTIWRRKKTSKQTNKQASTQTKKQNGQLLFNFGLDCVRIFAIAQVPGPQWRTACIHFGRKLDGNFMNQYYFCNNVDTPDVP